MSGTKILDQVEIEYKDSITSDILTVYLDVYDNSLSRKWLEALNQLLRDNYHLEKNYCFFGWPDGARNGQLLVKQINASIQAINSADLGYHIDDYYTIDNSIIPGELICEDLYPPGEKPDELPGEANRTHFNYLHRYFEDLQGVSGQMSPYYLRADAHTRWHIRQLNLLCHEFESWALSWRKKHVAPEWQRPSQLMCWLHAPRFVLEPEDYELFGIETINRPLGGVFVGVNKAVGKHHWEVFVDEAGYNPDMIIDNLITTTLRSQLEAAGDFDIEWANSPMNFPWQRKHLENFRIWLINNGFDPDDKSLTIGHPQVGQVDLIRSFGSTDYQTIWNMLSDHLNVYKICTQDADAIYEYNWNDDDFIDRQVKIIQGN